MRPPTSAAPKPVPTPAKVARRALLSRPPRQPWPDGAIHHGARLLILLALAGGLVLLYPSDPGVFVGRHELGTVAERDVIAVVGFDVPKAAELLRQERDAAMAAVIPTFLYREGAGQTALTAVNGFATGIDSAAAAAGVAGIGNLLSNQGIEASPEQIELLLDADRTRSIRDGAAQAIAALVEDGVMAPGAASRVDSDSLRIRRRGSEQVVARAAVLSGREFYDAALAEREEGPETDLVRLVLARYMVPSLVPDDVRIARERMEASDAIEVTAGRVLEGEAIVRANDPVGETEMQRLEAYREHLRMNGIDVDASNLSGTLGGFLLNLVILATLGVFLLLFRPDIYTRFRNLLALALVVALYFAGALLAALTAFPGALLPTVFVAVVLAILWDGRLALLTGLFIVALTSIQDPFASVDGSIVALAGGSTAALAMRSFRRLTQVWWLIAIAFAAYALALSAVFLRGADMELTTALMWALIGTIIWAFLAIGFLPVFEALTGMITDQTLAGWADANRPLLRKLAVEAPGTWAHTIQVAHIAESGANDVGANALLCRAGAYWHDIGKMVRPGHFIENQRGHNPLDEMPPDEAAATVRAHVVDGIEMAQRERLPGRLIDFIAEHHGDQTIGFFLERAREEAEREGAPAPDPSLFRYPGPRPRSRETAIVMLADSVESAARALKDPTPQRITGLVRQVFQTKLERGQLNRAQLTLRDMTRLRRRFAGILGGIHHRRIDYPTTRHLTTGAGAAAESAETSPQESQVSVAALPPRVAP